MVSITLQLRSKELRLAALREHIAHRRGIEIRPASKAIVGVLESAPKHRDRHAHLRIRPAGVRTSVLEYDLVTGNHGKKEPDAIRLDDFFEILCKFISDPEEPRRVLLSASFELSLKEWRPTVDLPFSLAGMTDALPGTPEIAGVDFTFEPTSTRERIHRAFVTTYDAIDKLVVRVLSTHDFRLSPVLPQLMLQTAESQLALFARRADR